MNTLDTATPPAPPAGADSGYGEPSGWIFLRLQGPTLNPENANQADDLSAVMAQMLVQALKLKLAEAAVNIKKFSFAGCMEDAVAIITLPVSQAMRARGVIEQFLRQADLAPYAELHALLDAGEYFRIWHCGEKLGPPKTLTLEDAQAALDSSAERMRAAVEKMNRRSPDDIAKVAEMFARWICGKPPNPDNPT